MLRARAARATHPAAGVLGPERAAPDLEAVTTRQVPAVRRTLAALPPAAPQAKSQPQAKPQIVASKFGGGLRTTTQSAKDSAAPAPRAPAPLTPKGYYPSIAHAGRPTRLSPALQQGVQEALGRAKAEAAARRIPGVPGAPYELPGPLQTASIAAGGLSAGQKILAGVKHLDPGRATNIVAGFGKTGGITGPGAEEITSFLIGRAQAKGNSLPANASLTDLTRAAYGPSNKPSWSGLLTNLPKDFALTPIYAAQGGYALGAAAAEAVKGNTAPLKDVAAQQVDILRHPIAFAQEHPFQALLAVSGGFKTGGAVEGRVRGLTETPRRVELPAFTDPETGAAVSVGRGVYSKNAHIRRMQALQDFLTRHGQFDKPGVNVNAETVGLQSVALRRAGRVGVAREEAPGQREANRIRQTLAEGAKGLKHGQKERALYAAGTGTHDLRDVLRFYENQPGAAAAKQASLVRAQIAKYGPTLTDAEQRYAQAAREAAGARTSTLKGVTTRAGTAALTDYTALRREYHPLIQRLAQQGDETAARFLDREQVFDQVRSQLKSNPGKQNLVRQHDALQRELSSLLDQIQQAHTGPEPFRVPFARANTRLPRMRRSVAPISDPAKLGLNVANPRKAYTGGAYASGEYVPSADVFERQVAAPSHAVASLRFAEALHDPQSPLGRLTLPAVAGQEVPAGFVARNRVAVTHKPSAEPAGSTGLDVAQRELETNKALLREFHPDLTHIPENAKPGDWVLVPKPLHDQLTRRAELPGSADKALRGISRTLNNAILYSRLAYPINNALTDFALGGFENVGPRSYRYARQAQRGEIPAPPSGVEDTGFVATSTQRSRVNLIREFERVNRDAAVGIDNLARIATYYKNAVPAARRLAHPDASRVNRFVASLRSIDQDTRAILEHMRTGATPEAQQAAISAADKVNRILGDFQSMRSSPLANVVFPWNRWPRFMFRLMAVTLPLHYPGKTLLLYRLGALGQQAQNQIGGALASWLQGIIPIGSHAALTTQSANPLATPASFLQPDPLSPTGSLNWSRIPGSVSPLWQTVQEVATGRNPDTGQILVNEKGEAIRPSASDRAHPPSSDSFTDTLRLLAGQVLGLVSPLRAAFQPQHAADTSISLPGLGQQLPYKPGQQPRPSLPAWAPVFNQVSPFKLYGVDIASEAQRGAQLLREKLIAADKADLKARAQGKTLDERIRLIQKWAQVNVDAATNMEKLLRDRPRLRQILAQGMPPG